MKRLYVLLPVLLAFLAGALPAHAWTWPVDGPVLQPFVFGENPYAAEQHRGIDIGGPAGGDVRAPATGAVTFSGSVPTSGRTVTIRSGDYSVTLVHLGSTAVSAGQTIAEGAVVGTIGPSGTPELDQPYVHVGVRIAADPHGYLDPLQFLPSRETASVPAPAEQDAAAEPVPAPEPQGAADTAAAPPPSSTAADSGQEAAAPSPADPAAETPATGHEPAPAEVPAPVQTPVREPTVAKSAVRQARHLARTVHAETATSRRAGRAHASAASWRPAGRHPHDVHDGGWTSFGPVVTRRPASDADDHAIAAVAGLVGAACALLTAAGVLARRRRARATRQRVGDTLESTTSAAEAVWNWPLAPVAPRCGRRARPHDRGPARRRHSAPRRTSHARKRAAARV